jgi:hypothetical protein
MAVVPHPLPPSRALSFTPVNTFTHSLPALHCAACTALHCTALHCTALSDSLTTHAHSCTHSLSRPRLLAQPMHSLDSGGTITAMNATAVVPSAPLKKMGASPSFWCVSDGTDGAMHLLAARLLTTTSAVLWSPHPRRVECGGHCVMVMTSAMQSSLQCGHDEYSAAVTYGDDAATYWQQFNCRDRVNCGHCSLTSGWVCHVCLLILRARTHAPYAALSAACRYGLQTANGDGALIQPILAWAQRSPGFGIFLEVFDW